MDSRLREAVRFYDTHSDTKQAAGATSAEHDVENASELS